MIAVRQSNTHTITTSRTARYYVSGDPASAPTLWVALHGYGQLAGEFIDDFASAVNSERAFVAPEALSRFYLRAGQGKIGANWMTAEDRENEIADYVNYLDNVVAATRTSATKRIFVLGFSQGSATACRWFASSAQRLSGITIWGGGAPPDLAEKKFIDRLDGRPMRFLHGTNDQYFSPTRLRLELQRLADYGIAHEAVEYNGGHEIPADVLLQEIGQQEGIRDSNA